MLTLESVRFERDGFVLNADCAIQGSGVSAVIGPSGGGKSTLLSLVAGFDIPDGGRLLWNGTDLSPMPPGKRPVAVLFQDNNLFPHLDILANVALGASPRTRPSAAVLSRARKALSQVGLDGMEHRKPGGLSGGQQSRAALARILLTDRPVVLMDEAFSALGPALRAEMLELVVRLLPDATILMVTHDPDDAARVAHQVVFVEKGTVHAPIPTREFFDSPSDAVRRYLA